MGGGPAAGHQRPRHRRGGHHGQGLPPPQLPRYVNSIDTILTDCIVIIIITSCGLPLLRIQMQEITLFGLLRRILFVIPNSSFVTLFDFLSD